MLTAYIVTMVVGLGLAVLGAVGAMGESEGDAGGDVHLGGDHGAAGHAYGGHDAPGHDAGGHDAGGHDADLAVFSWLPILSIRFWIYAAAGFGTTGTVLTYVERLQSTGNLGFVTVLGLSVGVGLATGYAVATVFRYLRLSQTDSSAGVADFVGREAQVMLPTSAERRGKIRLTVRGIVTDLPAFSPADIGIGRRVVVVRLDAGTATVEPLDASATGADAPDAGGSESSDEARKTDAD